MVSVNEVQIFKICSGYINLAIFVFMVFVSCAWTEVIEVAPQKATPQPTDGALPINNFTTNQLIKATINSTFATISTIANLTNQEKVDDIRLDSSGIPNWGSRCSLCKCGLSNHRKRIIGGVRAEIDNFPWQTLLFYENKFLCGGSLINNRYILTAAHCVHGFSVPQRATMFIKLLAREIEEIDEASIKRRISRFIVHPKYDSDAVENDIGLIRLVNAIHFNPRGSLRPICLPDFMENFNGNNGLVTGYGLTTENGKLSQVLLEAEVPILSAYRCNKETDYNSYDTIIQDTMICAGYVKGGVDHCFGDSGGPLQVLAGRRGNRFYLAGIVSFGVGCAHPKLPGVYTKVSSYLKWIERHTQDACYCLI